MNGEIQGVRGALAPMGEVAHARGVAVRDVVVIGGGLIGCAVARELAMAGLRVILVERGRLGGEASAAAAGLLGHLSEAEDETVVRYGAESRRLFPDTLAALAEQTGIQVPNASRGTLFVATDETERQALEERRKWLTGLGQVAEPIAVRAALALEPRLRRRLCAAVLFRDEGWVDNAELVRAYAEAARRSGAEIREGTRVLGVDLGGGSVRGVHTQEGDIACDRLVNAAGAWAGRVIPEAPLPLRPVRGQMVLLESPRGWGRRAVYSSSGYLVPRDDGRVLLGSTREQVGFDKRVTAGGVTSLLRAGIRMCPGLREQPVRRLWAGLRPALPDGLPAVGRDARIEGLLVATGHQRHGVLLAPLTARWVAAALRGDPEPAAGRVRPDRFGPQLTADGRR